MFHEEEFEIHVRANNTVLVFLWNVPPATIQRATMDLEMADIALGWGEGKNKIEADNDAWKTLGQRITPAEKNDSLHIEEKEEIYSADVAT